MASVAESTGEPAPSRSDIRLVFSASSVGTIFEWYDFFIYGTRAASGIIGRTFFPTGNETLATDAERVLQQNDPQHPYLTGDWPDYPWTIRKLNPFAGEKSALDNEE